jgi:VCBS repeat-containing protein
VGNSLLLSDANQVLAAGSAGNPGTSPVLDGKVADYGQLLEVDPNKLLSDTGIVYVTVAAAGNTPPTISDVTDKSTRYSTPTAAIAVTVADAETPVANLVLSASSSNPAIVLDSGIALGGSGANRTVTVTPVSGVIGNTTITLTVTDAMGFSATDTFVLSVTDSAPVASNGGFTVAASATATGSLTVVDSDGGPTAIVYSLVSAPTKGTVTITAATGAYSYTANAGVTGSDTFTFKANDGLMDSNVATETVTFGSGTTPPASGSSSSSSSCGLGSGVSALLSLGFTALVALGLRRGSTSRRP